MAISIADRNRKIWEAIKKGDLAVSDLISDGGYLPTEQENRFMRKVYISTGFINEIRKVEMTAPKRRINKIGITGNFLNVAPSSGTALDASRRSKVFTEYVELTTTELIGSMYIPYDVIEDNIEKDLLENTLMEDIIPPKVARDLEKVLLQGDTHSADNLLVAFDGILHQLDTGSNTCTYDDTTGQVTDDLWEEVLETLPYQYREREDMLRYYVHQRVSDAWNRWRRDRLTAWGDNAIIAGHMTEEAFRGIPIRKTPQCPYDQGVLSFPNNFILGTQRGVQVETARDIEARVIIIVVTLRVAVGIEEKEACVKMLNLNPSQTTSTT